jgi:hypothetical protein
VFSKQVSDFNFLHLCEVLSKSKKVKKSLWSLLQSVLRVVIQGYLQAILLLGTIRVSSRVPLQYPPGYHYSILRGTIRISSWISLGYPPGYHRASIRDDVDQTFTLFCLCCKNKNIIFPTGK